MINLFRITIFVLFLIFFSGCVSKGSVLTKKFVYQAQPEKAVIMVISAHPDDEGIFFGGTLPYYVQTLNIPVILISLTTDWLKSNGSRTSSSINREAEMREAAWRYGLRSEPVFSFFQQNIKYWAIDKAWDRWFDCILDYNDIEDGKIRVSKYLAEQIRLYRPDVIVTHGFKGEYGHPDHKALAYAAVAAFDLAAGKSAVIDDGVTSVTKVFPDGIAGKAWQVKKLYIHETDISNSGKIFINRLFHDHWEDLSIDTDGDGFSDKSPHQVADYALKAHESQGNQYVASVYDTNSRRDYSKYPSEWWGLYRSVVGADRIISTFTIPGDLTDSVYCNWARGNFLQNIEIK